MSFHSWSKLAIYEYIQIQFELIHIVLTKHVNIYIITREQLEEGLKNRNLKPEFAKDNSGSFYWNRIIFFDIAVPVNPESEFRILFRFQLNRNRKWEFTGFMAGIYRNLFF